MRVALDTTFLQRPPSGIGAYVAALSRYLPDSAPDLDLIRISQPLTGLSVRLGVRASRFLWESAGAGLATRKAAVDLLHMPMMARPVLAGTPVVVTVHDVIPFVMPEYRASRAMRVSLAVARQSLRLASAVITPSQHAAGDVARVLGYPRDKIHVTYEAADAVYRPLAASERGDRAVLNRYGISGPYVFNVGGLDVRKNLPVLLRAFREVIADGEADVRLVIAGAEHAENPVVFPPLRPLIVELGLEDRVILTGRIGDEDKIALMQRAMMYVTPSLYEGFGLTVLEAMACGIPVIASDRTSLPEVVGEAGILVPPRVDALSGALRRLALDPSLQLRLSRSGIERAARFSWKTCACETAEVYRHVLGKG
jgi:glycosyltransferase involved in cell wall biosynthesis